VVTAGPLLGAHNGRGEGGVWRSGQSVAAQSGSRPCLQRAKTKGSALHVIIGMNLSLTTKAFLLQGLPVEQKIIKSATRQRTLAKKK